MTDYSTSGVDLGRAVRAKQRIAAAVESTLGPRVLTGLGHFGGLYSLEDCSRSDVLVASTDGVGTKILLAVQTGKISGLGRDLVHHCINDILMCGARPMFFLDYMAFGRLEPDVVATLAESLAEACREHHVALIGGETAEMPGLYESGHFDLAGTIVGVVERDRILDGSRVRSGDVLLGLASNGLHTNGYSLVRRIFADSLSRDKMRSESLADGSSLVDALLVPHRCYLPSLGELLAHPGLRALAHVTGGGLLENARRVVPDGLHLDIGWSRWPRPELFQVIQTRGDVPEDEMRRVFNLGMGALVIADPSFAEEMAVLLRDRGEQVFIIGRVAA